MKIEIEVPEGMVIDKENSTPTCIKFKKKVPFLSYENIREKFFVARQGEPLHYSDKLPCSGQHFVHLEVYKRLLEVADYLNDGWKPDWNSSSETKWYIYVHNGRLHVSGTVIVNPVGAVYFKTADLANEAIRIIGADALEKLFQ